MARVPARAATAGPRRPPRRARPAEPPAAGGHRFQGRWALFSVVGLLLALVLVSLTAPRWAELLRRPLPEGDDESALPADPPPAESTAETAAETGAAGAGEAERRISVKLFLGHPEQAALVEEERAVPFASELDAQLRVVIEALIQGSQAELLPVLPRETRVLDVFVREGVATLNLSSEAASQHEGGTGAELLSVYAVVDTVTTNFPVVRRVQIVVDGAARPSLAGHLDLSAPLAADLSLLAPAPVRPLSDGQGVAPTPRPAATPREGGA